MSNAVVFISLETISDSLTKQGNPAIFESSIAALIDGGYAVGIGPEAAPTKVFTEAEVFSSWFNNLRVDIETA